MKLGEIKIEALKLMFAGNGSDYLDVGVVNLEEMKTQPEYSDYLGSMNGSINRCFSLLEERRVLPTKSFSLGGGERHDLGALISDFFDVERIVYEGDRGYNSSCEYFREGDSIIIKDYDERGEYRVLYKPKLERITPGKDEEYEIPIPDSIACLIPYFIKGELFRMDEPDEAAEARNWFEASLAEMRERDAVRQTSVVSRYSFSEV